MRIIRTNIFNSSKFKFKVLLFIEFPINSIAISSDQSFLATCDSNKIISVYNYRQLEKRLANTQKTEMSNSNLEPIEEDIVVDNIQLDNHEDSVNNIIFTNTSKKDALN